MFWMDSFDYIASKYPHKVAFIDNKRNLTFVELQNAVYHIASAIIEKGINKEAICVFLDKSVECVSAFFGVAFSGNFYTPIDTKMPVIRVKKIMEILKPRIIISDTAHLQQVKSFAQNVEILQFEDIMNCTIELEKINEVAKNITATDILYVLFTSGSTGTPKGVTMSHRAVLDYTKWVSDTFGVDVDSVLGNQSPLYFDLSIQDVYAPIITGCSVWLIPEVDFMNPRELLNDLYEKQVDTIVWVPSALCLLADLKALSIRPLPKLKRILFCGEVMPVKHLNKWRKAFPDTMFVNLYGPTEACDACMYYIIDKEFSDNDVLPIGRARRNVDVFLLGEQNELVFKVHELGEICIRGEALSYGYYNELAKTEKAFIQNPLQDKFPERVYLTGDLGYYDENGDIVYVSRKDYQIKHMGHRIELGEIETAVSAIEGIAQNCCLYDEGGKNIVVFYSGQVEEREIINSLRKALPEYMMPGKLCRMDEIPKNRNGKIDRVMLKNQISGK